MKELKKESKSDTNEMLTTEEKAAMKALAKERKLEAKLSENRALGEKMVLDAIHEMPNESQPMAKRLHDIIKANATGLSPKTWYGMPAYANADGKVVLFFRGAEKFKERYLTLGFNDSARLDEGKMWPIAYAIVDLDTGIEEKIAALITKSVR